MNHLQNVWFGGMEKKLTMNLNNILHTCLNEIDPSLCLTVSISAIICTVDKEVSVLTNYLEGHGELFLK